jgi:hypothetical protein
VIILSDLGLRGSSLLAVALSMTTTLDTYMLSFFYIFALILDLHAQHHS